MPTIIPKQRPLRIVGMTLAFSLLLNKLKSIFAETVVSPVKNLPYGKDRVLTLCEGWLSYLEHNTFRGGCFFAAATSEFDGKPGEIRDMLQEIMDKWLNFIRLQIVEAQRAGELSKVLVPEQIVFEIQSIVMGANWHIQLFGNMTAIERARTSIARILNDNSKEGCKKNV